MNETYVQLNNTLPLELLSRYLSYQVYTEAFGQNCTTFVLQVSGTDPSSLCSMYDMTNPNYIKFWVNATWYGLDSVYGENF